MKANLTDLFTPMDTSETGIGRAMLQNMPPEDTTLTMIERITMAMADLNPIDSFWGVGHIRRSTPESRDLHKHGSARNRGFRALV
jgi:hypothetical protein